MELYKVETITQHVHNAKFAIAAKLNEYAEQGYKLYDIYSIAASTPEYFNVIIVFIKDTPAQQLPTFAPPLLPLAIPLPANDTTRNPQS